MYEKGPYEKKYILFHIFFVRPLLEHGVYEKGPYEKIYTFHIFFVRPLLLPCPVLRAPCLPLLFPDLYIYDPEKHGDKPHMVTYKVRDII